MDVSHSRQGDDGGPSTSYQIAEDVATDHFTEVTLSQAAEASIEVVEVPSPPHLPQQEEHLPASSSAGEMGTEQPRVVTIEGNRELETALIDCLRAVTRVANELCDALQAIRTVCQAARR